MPGPSPDFARQAARINPGYDAAMQRVARVERSETREPQRLPALPCASLERGARRMVGRSGKQLQEKSPGSCEGRG